MKKFTKILLTLCLTFWIFNFTNANFDYEQKQTLNKKLIEIIDKTDLQKLEKMNETLKKVDTSKFKWVKLEMVKYIIYKFEKELKREIKDREAEIKIIDFLSKNNWLYTWFREIYDTVRKDFWDEDTYSRVVIDIFRKEKFKYNYKKVKLPESNCKTQNCGSNTSFTGNDNNTDWWLIYVIKWRWAIEWPVDSLMRYYKGNKKKVEENLREDFKHNKLEKMLKYLETLD